MDIDRLLRAMMQFEASDLHLQAGSPPNLRIDGKMSPLDMPPLTEEDVKDLVSQSANAAVRERIERDRAADFALIRPEIAPLSGQRLLSTRSAGPRVASDTSPDTPSR